MHYKKIIFSDSTEEERSTGPVEIIYDDGSVEYLVDGEYHREGLPSVVNFDKSRWYHEHGELHRTDGKAIINNDDFFSEGAYFFRGRKYDRGTFLKMLSVKELSAFLLNPENFKES